MPEVVRRLDDSLNREALATTEFRGSQSRELRVMTRRNAERGNRLVGPESTKRTLRSS